MTIDELRATTPGLFHAHLELPGHRTIDAVLPLSDAMVAHLTSDKRAEHITALADLAAEGLNALDAKA
jgi:hypothetical protein